ncbi:MAG: DUF4349 domain-containing protein [bacterium]|jgi:hypothetical protein
MRNFRLQFQYAAPAAILVLVSFVAVFSCSKARPAHDAALVLNSGENAKEVRGDDSGGWYNASPGSTAAEAPQSRLASGDSAAMEIVEASLDWMATPAVAAETQAMMVYNGNVALTAKEPAEAAKTIKAIAARKGGYTSSESQSGKDRTLRIGITVKMPSRHLFDFLDELATVGDIETKDISGQDVGQEYFDLKARRDSLELSYARLKELLEKTGKLSDLLAVEQEVRRTEEELNQVLGRMKQLENWVSYSTIDITITPFPVPDVFEKPKFSWLTNTAFGKYWNSFLVFARGLWHIVLFLTAFAPVWVSALIVALVIRNARRRKTARA